MKKGKKGSGKKAQVKFPDILNKQGLKHTFQNATVCGILKQMTSAANATKCGSVFYFTENS